jgi:hypothetical protein
MQRPVDLRKEEPDERIKSALESLGFFRHPWIAWVEMAFWGAVAWEVFV